MHCLACELLHLLNIEPTAESDGDFGAWGRSLPTAAELAGHALMWPASVEGILGETHLAVTLKRDMVRSSPASACVLPRSCADFVPAMRVPLPCAAFFTLTSLSAGTATHCGRGRPAWPVSRGARRRRGLLGGAIPVGRGAGLLASFPGERRLLETPFVLRVVQVGEWQGRRRPTWPMLGLVRG